MKKYYLLIFVLLVCLTIQAHDLRRTVFFLQIEEGNLVCHVQADRVRLLDALGANLSKEDLQNYTNTHFTVIFDHQTLPIQVIDYKLSADFLEYKIYLGPAIDNPQLIQVKSDFLIDRVERQENIVRLNFHGYFRSFQMNTSRQEIEVSYMASKD